MRRTGGGCLKLQGMHCHAAVAGWSRQAAQGARTGTGAAPVGCDRCMVLAPHRYWRRLLFLCLLRRSVWCWVCDPGSKVWRAWCHAVARAYGVRPLISSPIRYTHPTVRRKSPACGSSWHRLLPTLLSAVSINTSFPSVAPAPQQCRREYEGSILNRVRRFDSQCALTLANCMTPFCRGRDALCCRVHQHSD